MKRAETRVLGPGEFTEANVRRGQKIAIELTRLKLELFHMRMPKTVAALGLAIDKIGYELAERMEGAGLVGKEEKAARKRRAAFQRREARERAARNRRDERALDELLAGTFKLRRKTKAKRKSR